MKAISVYIQLNSVVLQFCESFTVESSWDNFTDTAMIVVPNIVFKSETSNASVGLDSLLQRGDPVEIRAGYNKGPDELESLFKGFISDVETGTLIKIQAQDAMYALKQTSIETKTFKKATLKELIDHITKDTSIESDLIDDNIGMGDWAIENNSFHSAVDVLNKIKNDYGFVSFIKDGKLRVGVPYDANGVTHYLLKELNFSGPDNLVNQVNDTKRVLKGISIKPDNTRIIKYATKDNETITVSDDEIFGELRTLNYYNMTASELEEILKTVFQTVNWTGLEGGFQTFGEPVIRYNDYIKLKDLKNSKRKGSYKVKKVIYSMSPGNGLRQDVEIDYSITEINKNS